MQYEKFEKFVIPQTCENWLGLVNSCIYYVHQTHEIFELLPYLLDFKASWKFWNPVSETVLNKCSFIWNTGPLNIWNDHKPEE